MIWLNFLSSVKLTVALLTLIVIASVAGTIIPHGSDNQIFVKLQLTNVYHSYWYMALLALFCINLFLCSLKNIPVLFRSLIASVPELELTELNQLPFYKNIKLGTVDVSSLASTLSEAITHRLFYKIKYSELNNGFYYFERDRISRFGPFIIHASIIIILIGGIIVGMTEFKDYIRIPEGATIAVPGADFEVKTEDFSVEFYPNSNTPKEYVTKLSVIDNDKTVLTKNIKVNHPLNYKGTKFLQSNYGFINTVGIEINKKISSESAIESLGEFKIDEGQTIEVTGTDLKVNLRSYVPNYAIDDKGNVSSLSSEPRNPAVLLELTDDKGLKERIWLFMKFTGSQSSKQSDYTLEFVSIYPPTKYYTELQVRHNHGIEIIWIGFLLIICGLILSFYASHKKLWLKISSDGGKTSIEIGGSSHRNKAGFDREIGVLSKYLNIKI